MYTSLAGDRQIVYRVILRNGVLGRVYVRLGGDRSGVADRHDRVHGGLGVSHGSSLQHRLRGHFCRTEGSLRT